MHRLHRRRHHSASFLLSMVPIRKYVAPFLLRPSVLASMVDLTISHTDSRPPHLRPRRRRALSRSAHVPGRNGPTKHPRHAHGDVPAVHHIWHLGRMWVAVLHIVGRALDEMLVTSSDCISIGTRNVVGPASWRIVVGVGIVWAAILGFGILLMPESPRSVRFSFLFFFSSAHVSTHTHTAGPPSTPAPTPPSTPSHASGTSPNPTRSSNARWPKSKPASPKSARYTSGAGTAGSTVFAGLRRGARGRSAQRGRRSTAFRMAGEWWDIAHCLGCRCRVCNS